MIGTKHKARVCIEGEWYQPFTRSPFAREKITPAQLENLDDIQNRRKKIWNHYHEALSKHPVLQNHLPSIPENATNNAHMFYVILDSLDMRTSFITHLKNQNVQSVFHYQSLHASAFQEKQTRNQNLPESDRYSHCLVRLPFFYTLDEQKVIDAIATWEG